MSTLWDRGRLFAREVDDDVGHEVEVSSWTRGHRHVPKRESCGTRSMRGWVSEFMSWVRLGMCSTKPSWADDESRHHRVQVAGNAAQDLAAAHVIYDRAVRDGIGTRAPF